MFTGTEGRSSGCPNQTWRPPPRERACFAKLWASKFELLNSCVTSTRVICFGPNIDYLVDLTGSPVHETSRKYIQTMTWLFYHAHWAPGSRINKLLWDSQTAVHRVASSAGFPRDAETGRGFTLHQHRSLGRALKPPHRDILNFHTFVFPYSVLESIVNTIFAGFARKIPAEVFFVRILSLSRCLTLCLIVMSTGHILFLFFYLREGSLFSITYRWSFLLAITLPHLCSPLKHPMFEPRVMLQANIWNVKCAAEKFNSDYRAWPGSKHAHHRFLINK